MTIVKNKPKDFMLISGDDMLTAPLYSIGGIGVISVLANAVPMIFKKMKEHAFNDAFLKASQEQFKLLEINGPMYEEGNPSGVKYLLSLLGIVNEFVRLPLATPSSALRQKISRVYSSLK